MWLVFGLLLYAAWTDMVRFRIANAVPIGILLFFPAHALAVGRSLHEVAYDFLAGGSTLVVTFLLYTAGLRFGGGDAKAYIPYAIAIGGGFVSLYI